MMQALEKAGRRAGIAQPALRSGAGIAANLSEAVYGSRRRDFFSNPRIALKEYSGTHARPKLLRATGSLTETESSSVNQDSTEIPKMLISINKPTQQAQPDSY
jgi:four helix bundle protein